MKCLACNHELGEDGACRNCKKVKKLIEADLARRRAPKTEDVPPLTQQTQSIPQASPSAKKPIPRRVGMVHVAVGLLGLAMLFSPCFKGPRERIPGEVCIVLQKVDGLNTPTYASEDDYLRMLSSSRSKDIEGIFVQTANGGITWLVPKTRIRILAYHQRTETYEVRVLEGEYYGQVVWIKFDDLQ
jgi:hypothetical protein